MKMKSVGLRKAIMAFGGSEIGLRNHYHFQSGFFVKGGQLYYISTSDDRDRRSDGQLMVYYRTAESRHDFRGGPNLWDFVPAVNRLGYRVDKAAPTRERY